MVRMYYKQYTSVYSFLIHSLNRDDGDFKSGKCSKSKLPQSSFPKIWDWVKNATYTGRYEFLNFDSWSFQVSC